MQTARIFALAFIVLAVPARAQEVSVELPPYFEVPQDAEIPALFRFVESIEQAELPPEEDPVRFLKEQVRAVLAACDLIEKREPDPTQQLRVINMRIDAYRALEQVDPNAAARLNEYVTGLKDDPRPEVQKVVAGQSLITRGRAFFQLPGDQQQAFVNDLVAYLNGFGVDRISLQLSQAIGQALEHSSQPQLGAPVYAALAEALAKMGDPRLQSDITQFEGIARRLNLHGNFMPLEGTTIDSMPLDWDSYRGKVVLVNFWASWCGPCRAEFPNLNAQLDRYGERFAVVGICLDESPAAFQAAVEQDGIRWANLVNFEPGTSGFNHPMAVKYGINSTPTAILLDREGQVVSLTAHGEILNAMLDQIFSPPAQPESTDPQPSNPEPPIQP